MALAIVLTFAGTTTSWAALGMGDISFDGSLEVSGNSANNEVDQGSVHAGGTTNDHRGNTATRLRLGMNAEVTENVKARIELIRDPRLYGTSPTNLNGEQTALVIHNAYLDLNLWDHMFRLGRQYVGNPGDLVWNISPTDDDSLTANSIDGLLIQCRKMAFLNLDFFTGKASEDDGIANTDADDGAGDLNLSSLDGVLPTLIPGAKINVGYLWGVDSNTDSVEDENKLNTIRVGINGGIKENMFTYRAEYFVNGGEVDSSTTSTDYKGTALDLGVGINPAETGIGTFKIWGNLLMASGDDNAGDTDDESFHDFSALGLNTSDRLMGEIFGKSNTLTAANGAKGVAAPVGQGADTGVQGAGMEVINIGISLAPKIVPKGSVRLDWFMFDAAEDGTTSRLPQGDSYGDEFDLTFGYAQSDNVNIEAGYAMLSPGDAITGTGATTPDEDITKLFARLKVKWGGEAK